MLEQGKIRLFLLFPCSFRSFSQRLFFSLFFQSLKNAPLLFQEEFACIFL
ncbi:hypothetical protein HMPREF6123_1738 [Oribacterium sinus F0268]|uniref:Uncharacterized protein n=1 Tax=Oribacterium sinus F0268 TaxID=585501 RepID=C2KZ19_9FIRM|nr:hypothetical protein HMPREF6123_1738 [Oribacterium sinus F0268]